jgi:nucleoid-associated protein YgaU
MAGEQLMAKSEDEKAEELKKRVADNGIDVDGLDIKVEGDKVQLGGKAVSQEAREKARLVVGNTDGISFVEDVMTTAATDAGESQFHTVEKGDTLSAIAKKFYGDANKYPQIFEANKPMLKDPNLIYPGQVLRIPKA